nr:Chain E, Mitogen-activated protein kinase 12 [Homo sapiens]5EZ0_F Chain F, Mitogen-activated protein kinase 12 [Homo sapiens]5EZ0_G Chain G, Mitogen-activated protein kinase 12 [Homo sapiens]5EZ0_H Chain H, Mitogen-activated protein kinase 12 [Homo sapiens]
SWARVSKETPL